MNNTLHRSISRFLQKGKIPFCVWLLLCFTNHISWSQSGNLNPFEIKTDQTSSEPKIEEKKEVKTNSNQLSNTSEIKTTTINPFEQADGEKKNIKSIPTAPVSNGNPFDISTSSDLDKNVKKKKRSTPKTVMPTKQEKTDIANVTHSNKKDASSNNSGFIFVLIVIITVLFAVLLTLFRGYFGKVYQAFINDSQLRSAYREMGSTIIFPYIVLYGMFIINASVLLYVILTKNGISFGDNWKSWLYILVGLLLVFLGKHLMLSFFGSTFPVSKETKLYNFTIVVFNIMLGAIFVPIILLYAYGPDNLLVALTYLTIIVVVLLYIYRSIRVLLIGGKYLGTHKFHFFMYLCTAEIAPLLLLIRFISNNVY